MDVVPATNFSFNSSPINGSYYASAPSSPTRIEQLYCQFDQLLISHSSIASVPFAWEEKPGVPKTHTKLVEYGDEFSFDVRSDLGTGSVSAEDLFQGGRIKTVDSPERGRERGFSRLTSSRSRRTRSLSPLGISDYRREQQPVVTTSKTKPEATSACSSETGSKRWSFRDLFLFRSASDGRAMDKYPLRKNLMVNRKTDDIRNSGELGSVSKRRGRVSAHEMHYNLNRANSNELKKRTYLPYKQGILG